jgi:hypothetical protein
MGVKVSGSASGADVGVGLEAMSALHASLKPHAASVGHFRTNHRAVLTTAQAANSRLFEIRNTSASLLLIPTRLIVKVIQSAAGTAQEASLDVFKVTGFSAVDTTNTVTPSASQKRASMGASSAAALRGVTLAGAAAGMTGGTLTKDGTSIGQLPVLVTAAAQATPFLLDVFDDVNGTHPFVFTQNEGLIIENRALNATSYGCTVYIDFSWLETSAF